MSDPHDDRQQDDRDDDVAVRREDPRDPVEEHEHDEQRLEDRREQPRQEVDRVRAGRGRRERGLAGDRASRRGRCRGSCPGRTPRRPGRCRTRSRIGASRARNGERRVTRWFSIRSADRVVAARVPGVTAADASGAHPAAAQQPVLAGSPARCSASTSVRTGSSTASMRRRRGRADERHPDRDPDASHDSDRPPSTPPERRTRRNAPTSASWSASTIAGRAMMRTSQPGWNEGAITLSASRMRRRTRFRMTAPPSRLPVASPNRVWSRSFRTNRPTSRGWRPRDAALRQPGEVARAGEHDEPQRVVTAPVGQAESCFRPLARRRREHSPPARRLHAGAEAVLLGAMSLLGLKCRLAHRDCP